ncbi:MAG: 3-deoxy-D-manno-octulosonic acid transferase [Phycisphaerae bacterium]|nr:3-deoxy-D-manno-octulosonic acid transferase [Phycisphaerae bacterium]
MRFVLDVLYLLAGVLLLPVLAYQRFVKGKRRGGWGERFGRLPARTSAEPAIWIHAVSLGETNATRGLVDALAKAIPDCPIVISATTDTGYARARQLYPDHYVFRYPLDLSCVVRRVLRTVRPALIALMELEVWPNLIDLAARQGIPVAVVNGRLTEHGSMRPFRKPIVRSLARRMFRRLAWVGAQNETYAERFRELGVPAEHIQIAGTLKWDTAQIADDLPGTAALAEALGIDCGRPLWVFGQSGPGEERIALDTLRILRGTVPDVQLAIVPRKPERFDEVAALIADAGWSFVRRSNRPDGSAPPATRPDVILGDTMGELRKFYCLAKAVFVGRSIAPMGGSDVIEVAALARPIVVGPHTENFADSVAELAAAGGLRVCETDVTRPDAAETLAASMRDLLADATASSRMGLAARQVVQQNQGVTQRTVDALAELVYRAQHRCS